MREYAKRQSGMAVVTGDLRSVDTRHTARPRPPRRPLPCGAEADAQEALEEAQAPADEALQETQAPEEAASQGLPPPAAAEAEALTAERAPAEAP